MRIANVEFMLRRNLGNYEHSEIKLSAVVEEGEEVSSVIDSVKSLAHSSLYHDLKVPDVIPEEPKKEVAVEKPKVSKPNAEKATVAEKVELKPLANEPVATATIVKEGVKEQPKSKNVELYDNGNKDHKSVMAGYLTKTFGDAWKTHPELKTLSPSLHGKDFRDTTTGLLIPSFEAAIKTFFGLY